MCALSQEKLFSFQLLFNIKWTKQVNRGLNSSLHTILWATRPILYTSIHCRPLFNSNIYFSQELAFYTRIFEKRSHTVRKATALPTGTNYCSVLRRQMCSLTAYSYILLHWWWNSIAFLATAPHAKQGFRFVYGWFIWFKMKSSENSWLRPIEKKMRLHCAGCTVETDNSIWGKQISCSNNKSSWHALK